MKRYFLMMFAGLGLFACNEPVDEPQTAEAVGVELPTHTAEPEQLVTVAGTVRVFGQEEVTLSNVTVCEESTATCTTTDGAGDFELYAPTDRDLILVATRADLFTSVMPLQATAGLSVDLRVMPQVATEAFVELADGEMTVDTGMAFVLVTDDEGAPLDDSWMTIRDFAAWGPIFTEPNIVPALDRKRTGTSGVGAYLELPEGFEEIGVGGGDGHDDRDCTSPYLERTDEELFRVPVRGEAITWLHVVCE